MLIKTNFHGKTLELLKRGQGLVELLDGKQIECRYSLIIKLYKAWVRVHGNFKVNSLYMI